MNLRLQVFAGAPLTLPALEWLTASRTGKATGTRGSGELSGLAFAIVLALGSCIGSPAAELDRSDKAAIAKSIADGQEKFWRSIAAVVPP